MKFRNPCPHLIPLDFIVGGFSILWFLIVPLVIVGCDSRPNADIHEITFYPNHGEPQTWKDAVNVSVGSHIIQFDSGDSHYTIANRTLIRRDRHESKEGAKPLLHKPHP